MLIGILQTGHATGEIRDRFGDFDAMFQRLLGGRNYDFRTFNVVDMEFPTGPGDADGWLITGSKHGAYDDLPFIAPLEALIRDIRDAGRPLVGICFGHQIIAQALGGRVEKFAGGWAVGRQTYRIGDGEHALVAWHQDQVTQLPEGADVLSSTEICKFAALAYGDRIFTLQPHPEFGRDETEALIRFRGPGVVPDGILAVASANLDAPLDQESAADMMARVLEGRA